MASQRKNEIPQQCPKQPEKLLCRVTHHHCNVLKCDFLTMNARFLPSTIILNGIKYVKECYGKKDEELIFTVCMVFKFAEYPCFSVGLAGSLHFPKEKYLYIVFVHLF